MNKANPPSVYDFPELYDLLFDQLDFDLPYWIGKAGAAGGPVLEVGCGSGRLLLPIAKAGVDIEGLDASRAMIRRLKAKAAAAGLPVRTKTADMRDFSMGRRYALVFCAFNGFAHCETVADQIACLKACRRHLEPGGAVAVHMTYPGPAYWLEPEGKAVLELETPLPGGGKLELWDDRRKDPVAQKQESTMEIREFDGAGGKVETRTFHAVQRWVYRFELELLFAAAGFARCEFYGGFDEKALGSPEDQMVAWAFRGEDEGGTDE
jgi:SAM-dependent methyltransferase